MRYLFFILFISGSLVAKDSLSFFEKLTLDIQGDALHYYQQYLQKLRTQQGMLKSGRELPELPGYSTKVVRNHGILIPGVVHEDGKFSPNTFRIVSDEKENVVYVQGPKGELQILFNNADSYSKIELEAKNGKTEVKLGGVLTIKGNEQTVIDPGKEVPIITAPSGIQGRFDRIQLSGPIDLIPHVTYSANAVNLSFSPTISSYVSSIVEPIFFSVNRTNLFLLKEIFHLRSNMSYQNKEILPPPISQLTCEAETTEEVGKCRIKNSEMKRKPNRVYIGPTAAFGNVNSSGSQEGFGYWSAGLIAGYDRLFSQGAFGALVNYDRFSTNVQSNWGTTTINEVLTSLYGTWAPNAFSIDATLGGAYSGNSIYRNTGTPKGSLIAKGSPDGGLLEAFLDFAYTFSGQHQTWWPSCFQFMPLASLQYIYLHLDSYHESGAGGYDLSVKDQRAKSLRSTLELLCNYSADYANWKFRAEWDAGWQWEFMDRKRSLNFVPLYVPGPSTTLTTVGATKSIWLIGANLLFLSKNEGFRVTINYDFEWNHLYYDNYFLFTIGSRW